MAKKKKSSSAVYKAGASGKRKMNIGNVVMPVEPGASENYNRRRKASAKKEQDDKTVSNKRRLRAGADVARHSMALAAAKGLKKRDAAKAKKKTSAAKRYQNQK